MRGRKFSGIDERLRLINKSLELITSGGGVPSVHTAYGRLKFRGQSIPIALVQDALDDQAVDLIDKLLSATLRCQDCHHK